MSTASFRRENPPSRSERRASKLASHHHHQQKGYTSLILSTSQRDLNVKSRALYIIPGSQVREGSLTCWRGEQEVWCCPKRRASYDEAGESERVDTHIHSLCLTSAVLTGTRLGARAASRYFTGRPSTVLWIAFCPCLIRYYFHYIISFRMGGVTMVGRKDGGGGERR